MIQTNGRALRGRLRLLDLESSADGRNGRVPALTDQVVCGTMDRPQLRGSLPILTES